jgi:two-component system chemotaxis sensor kinase CheA
MGFEAHKDLFVEEAIDILRDVEGPLMELELHPDRRDLIDTIFRAMHTIKGSAGMFGYDDIAHFTHDIETTFDAVRKGELAVSSDIIELTLLAKDCIRELLSGNNSDEQKDKRGMILSRLSEIGGKKDAAAVKAAEIEIEKPTAAGACRSYDILFAPEQGIFLRGIQVLPLFAELATLGSTALRASLDSLPVLEDFNPELCYLSWTIRISTDKPVEDIRSVFIFVEDYAKISIREISENAPVCEVVNADLSGNVKQALPEKTAPIIERRRVDSSSIRVKNEKLDMLVNLVGEMVTLHARLSQESNREYLPEFISISESLGRLTADLRDVAMSVRMVPLAETFSSYNRLVHDLSKNLGKKIRFDTEGGETELDKNVIEELRDPLMHLIRNAADHGIELPDVRSEHGKEETGQIRISAEYAGANVRIRIEDDGAGLDRGRILAKALERGMNISPDADDTAIYQLIFEPGFSTAAKATDISGRGVGMDVVKRNLEKLRGTIGIATEAGKSTAISLTIPLTLAIIDGFMTEVCGQSYIFNLSMVRECIAFEQGSDSKEFNGLVRLRENYIPFVDLRSVFDLSGEKCLYPQIVVTEYEGNTVGFLVDRVAGHCQTVIKPLGKGVRNAEMFSGAAILGNGSIALILDVNRIIEKAEINGVSAAGASALYAGG